MCRHLDGWDGLPRLLTHPGVEGGPAELGHQQDEPFIEKTGLEPEKLRERGGRSPVSPVGTEGEKVQASQRRKADFQLRLRLR